MDNFSIDLVAEGSESLLKAMEIAFAHNAPGRKVRGYQIVTMPGESWAGVPAHLVGRTALVLRWSSSEDRPGAVDLPFSLDAAGAADFAQRWLAEQDFGDEPGHDGSNRKGWRLFAGPWGHVAMDHYSVIAVFPNWSLIGK